MFGYILHRLITSIPLLLGITLLSFLVIQLAPGDPVSLQTDLNPNISPAAYEKLREQFHLDDPLPVQYFRWLTDILRGDFGTSLAPDGRDVLEKISAHLPITLWMNVIGLALVLLLATPIGVLSAQAPGKWFDRSSTVFVFIGFAAPSFWVGLLGMLWFGVHLGWLPVSGIQSYGSEFLPFAQRLLDWGWHLTLPIMVGVLGSLAGMSRYLRSSMLEVVRQDYVLTAQAKGATKRQTMLGHALPNALLPVITVLGLSVPGLIGGSVIIESLFGIPGMGKLFYDGVMMRDYPVIMGILTLGAVLTLLGNLLADVGYALADPRVRQN